MKKDLAGMQGDLAHTGEDLAKLRGRLAITDRAVQRVSATLKKYLDGEYQSPLLNESFREDTRERILQNLRKTTTARRNLTKAIGDLDEWSRGLKDSIDELLKEIADCR